MSIHIDYSTCSIIFIVYSIYLYFIYLYFFTREEHESNAYRVSQTSPRGANGCVMIKNNKIQLTLEIVYIRKIVTSLVIVVCNYKTEAIRTCRRVAVTLRVVEFA